MLKQIAKDLFEWAFITTSFIFAMVVLGLVLHVVVWILGL